MSLDIHSKVKWARRQVGKTLVDIAVYFQGDLEKTFGMLMPKEKIDDGDTFGKVSVPDSYKLILDEILKG